MKKARKIFFLIATLTTVFFLYVQGSYQRMINVPSADLNASDNEGMMARRAYPPAGPAHGRIFYVDPAPTSVTKK